MSTLIVDVLAVDERAWAAGVVNNANVDRVGCSLEWLISCREVLFWSRWLDPFSMSDALLGLATRVFRDQGSEQDQRITVGGEVVTVKRINFHSCVKWKDISQKWRERTSKDINIWGNYEETLFIRSLLLAARRVLATRVSSVVSVRIIPIDASRADSDYWPNLEPGKPT